jgi:hypothetical protein
MLNVLTTFNLRVCQKKEDDDLVAELINVLRFESDKLK